MSPYLLLYILTRLDYVPNFAGPIVGVTIFYFVLTTLVYYIFKLSEPTYSSFDKEEEKKDKLEKHENAIKNMSVLYRPKTCLAIVAFFLFINFATPTKNEALVIIAGGKAIDFAVNNDSINKMPSKAADIVVAYMDKTLEELKQQTTKK